jgi:hypothetical protein
MCSPSDIARPHDDQTIARRQVRFEVVLNIRQGVRAKHLLPKLPRPRGQVGRRDLVGLGLAFSGTKDVGYQHPLGILQAQGQFVQ